MFRRPKKYFVGGVITARVGGELSHSPFTHIINIKKITDTTKQEVQAAIKLQLMGNSDEGTEILEFTITNLSRL